MLEIERFLKDFKSRDNKLDEYNPEHRKTMLKKFLNSPSSLDHSELLEILLYHLFPRQDTNNLAKSLLDHFGSLRGFIFCDKSDLDQIQDIGIKAITLISTMRELFTRASFDAIKNKKIINCNSAVKDYYKNVFGGLKNEQLRVMFINGNNHVISDEILQEGTVDQANVYFRNIVHRALRHRAKSILVSHNHPSGDPSPSPQDITATKELEKIARSMNIALLDHVIIGGTSIWSIKNGKII